MSARELRSDASAVDLSNSAESRTLLSRDYTEFQPPASQKESATRALSREISEHKRRLDDETYLDKAVSFITEPIHHSSANLEKLEQLKEASRNGTTPESEKEIRKAIRDDSSSLETKTELDAYGGGMAQTAGLFVGGRKGLAYTAIAFAAGAAKPADSKLAQVEEGALGVGKGLLTRGLFLGIGQSSLSVPSKALMMGGSSRFADALMSGKTYVDPQNGGTDVVGGIGRVFTKTLDPTYLASDLLVFGGGQLAMQSSSVRQFVQGSPLRATMASAGAFGFASGGAEEFKNQWTTGKFDPLKIAGRAFLRGGADMISAIPGGMQASRAAAVERETSLGLARGETSAMVVAEPRQLARVIRENIASAKPNFSRGTSREFQVVGGDRSALDLIGRSKAASAVVDVRELSESGSPTGPVKKLLVQHVDDTTPIRSRLASTVDLIASCNPQTLCNTFRSKHLFPENTGSVFFTKLQDRLSFGAERPAFATAGSGAIELGGRTRSVSELLLMPETKNMLRTPRVLDLYAKEMQHFKDPAIRVIDGGADSIVIELADGRILKMTDRPYRKSDQPLWRPEWGFRTIQDDNGGVHQFDARLLTKPTQIEVNHQPIMYYIQERARTPVTLKTLERFHTRIDRDGNYVFWDGGASSLGQAQLGYIRNADGSWSARLLDYDAVRRPGEVPADMGNSPGSGNHWMSRYRGDNVDWTK